LQPLIYHSQSQWGYVDHPWLLGPVIVFMDRRWIEQYHLRHHFIIEKHWFGVSNPTPDGAFGTFRGPGASEKSASTRNLFS
jgi:hypothetical protein